MAAAAGLAGRTDELSAVVALLSGVTDSAGMLVVGEAGVGKSRLVTAAAAIASDLDVSVVSGWCLQMSGGLPFLPVVDVLRGLGEVDEGRLIKAALAECAPFVAGELLRLMPQLSEAAPPPMTAETDDHWRRQRLFEALRRVFAALAQLRPIGMVIEDVHWADATTLELLDYLLTPGHVIGLPLLLTCRSEHTPGPALVGWLERMERNAGVTRVDLAPLSAAETGEQIGLLLGHQPAATLVAEIYARSEGNAFFTEQLLAARSGDEDGARLPAGLNSLLLSRTAQVTGAARDVLAVLSVAACPMDEPALIRLCGRPARETRAALQDLLDRQLLRRPGRDGGHQLRHALLAEAMSADLLPGERRELHERIAALLADRDDPNLAAQIAEHYAAADRPADELRWRVRAGQHADAVYAPSEAAGHWRRAVDLTDDAAVTEMIDGLSLAELYGAAEDALELSGDDEAVLALAEQALGRLADADPAGRADTLRRAGLWRARTAPQQGLDLLREALALYERLPPNAAHVETLYCIAGTLGNEFGREREAATLIDRAVEVAERADDRAAHMKMLSQQATHTLAAGHAELAIQQSRALCARLTSGDDPDLHARLALNHTYILLSAGRLAEVEAAGAPALHLAAAHGMDHAWYVTCVRSNVVEALIDLGSIDAAAGWLDLVSPGGVGLRNRNDHCNQAILEMLRGDLDAAEARWERVRGMPGVWLSWEAEDWVWEAELHLWRRLPGAVFDQAQELLDRAAEADQGTLSGALLVCVGPVLVVSLRACADMAEHGRAGRDAHTLEVAQRCAAQLSDLHRQFHPDPFTPSSLWPAAVADGAVWRAEWSRLVGESDPELWGHAATAWDELTRPHRAAYTRWRQAEALLAAPRGQAAATSVLRTAAHQAAQHAPLSDAIADLARRARIDLDVPSKTLPDERSSSRDPFGLTGRELAVLRLLGEGRSNPQIAAELFISPKTASVHVTHILRKLGVATRVEAATVAERAGLLVADRARRSR